MDLSLLPSEADIRADLQHSSGLAFSISALCQLRKSRVSFEGDDGQLTIPQEEARSETARCRQKAPS